jgi:hypothetical protein
MASGNYLVRVSAAKMPTSCWGKYVHVAVVEAEPGVEYVSMISTRARGVRRVVQRWSRCHVGSTQRSASEQAISRAHELAAELDDADERTSVAVLALQHVLQAMNGFDPFTLE